MLANRSNEGSSLLIHDHGNCCDLRSSFILLTILLAEVCFSIFFNEWIDFPGMLLAPIVLVLSMHSTRAPNCENSTVEKEPARVLSSCKGKIV